MTLLNKKSIDDNHEMKYCRSLDKVILPNAKLGANARPVSERLAAAKSSTHVTESSVTWNRIFGLELLDIYYGP